MTKYIFEELSFYYLVKGQLSADTNYRMIYTWMTVFLSKQTILLMVPTMEQTLYITSTLMGNLAFKT